MRAHIAALMLVWPLHAAPALPAREPPTPPMPLAVRAEGSVTTGTVRGKVTHRYSLTPPAKGTLMLFVHAIHGSSPRAVLKTADGRIIRRDRNGQIWTRSPPGEALVLEVKARAPDAPGVYLLRVVLDVDRPRAERDEPRPVRPGDVVIVSKRGQAVERVLVDGIVAEFKDRGPDAIVTIPAFARTGRVELHRESGEPDVVTLALIGAEPASPDLVGDACSPPGPEPVPGCIEVTLAPSVGTAWLQEVARVVDADIVMHAQRTGRATLKLRNTSNEAFSIRVLSAMPGIRAAHR